MLVRQQLFIKKEWQNAYTDAGFVAADCNLVLVFGGGAEITDPTIFSLLKDNYANADIVFSSTAGEILDEAVYDNTIVVTAIAFGKTRLKSASLNIKDFESSFEVGAQLMATLDDAELATLLVISDGALVNGSELVAGLNKHNSRQVPIAGGLAGDADRFKQTFTGLNAVPEGGNIIAVGFYGNSLAVGHGSVGGWDEFGPERTITRSDKNVLYELDGKNALSLYKEYLGDYANDLPSSALLFPLSLKVASSDHGVVRTILAVDEANNSMTFAGNIPEGSKVRLMKANFDKLIEASNTAASNTSLTNGKNKAGLAILISCVGRKLILQQRVSEEVEAAKEFFGNNIPITGFYSYGEISSLKESTACDLHNQTMTILTFSEL